MWSSALCRWGFRGKKDALYFWLIRVKNISWVSVFHPTVSESFLSVFFEAWVIEWSWSDRKWEKKLLWPYSVSLGGCFVFLSNSPHNLHGCCQQTQRGKDYAFISPSYEAFFLSGLWSIYVMLIHKDVIMPQLVTNLKSYDKANVFYCKNVWLLKHVSSVNKLIFWSFWSVQLIFSSRNKVCGRSLRLLSSCGSWKLLPKEEKQNNVCITAIASVFPFLRRITAVVFYFLLCWKTCQQHLRALFLFTKTEFV